MVRKTEQSERKGRTQESKDKREEREREMHTINHKKQNVTISEIVATPNGGGAEFILPKWQLLDCLWC